MIQWIACVMVTGLVVQDGVTRCYCRRMVFFSGGRGRNGVVVGDPQDQKK